MRGICSKVTGICEIASAHMIRTGNGIAYTVLDRIGIVRKKAKPAVDRCFVLTNICKLLESSLIVAGEKRCPKEGVAAGGLCRPRLYVALASASVVKCSLPR